MKKHDLVKVLTALVCAVVLSLLLVSNVDAVGYVVAPASIQIDDAVAGTEYQRQISAKYSENTTVNRTCLYVLSASDDLSGWVTFWDMDSLNTPVDNVTGSEGEWKSVLVKFSIPQDTTLGTHTGVIYIDFQPEQVSAIGYKGQIGCVINVTDRVRDKSDSLQWWWIAAPVAGIAVIATGSALYLRGRKPRSKSKV